MSNLQNDINDESHSIQKKIKIYFSILIFIFVLYLIYLVAKLYNEIRKAFTKKYN
jgi:uncharacterized membrane protein YvbJ